MCIIGLRELNVLIGGVRSSGLCTRPQIEQTGSTCGLVSLHQRSVMATSKFTFIELTYSQIHLIQTWLFQIPHVFKLNSITLALTGTLQTFKIGYFKLLLFPTFFVSSESSKQQGATVETFVGQAEPPHATELKISVSLTSSCTQMQALISL